MGTRKEIDPEDLTLEDRDIWMKVSVTAQWVNWESKSPWEFAAIADELDARRMLWIQNQASYAVRQEKRFGRGKRLRSVHPLARIGM